MRGQWQSEEETRTLENSPQIMTAHQYIEIIWVFKKMVSNRRNQATRSAVKDQILPQMNVLESKTLASSLIYKRGKWTAEWYKSSQPWRRYIEKNLVFELDRIDYSRPQGQQMHYVCGQNSGCPFTNQAVHSSHNALTSF